MNTRDVAVLLCATALAALSGCDGDTSPAGAGAGGSSGTTTTTTTTTGGGGGSAATGPTLGSFAKSACKKEPQAKSGSWTLGGEPASYAGLECVRWAPIDGGFQIFLRNFDGPCGAEWEGSVKALASATELRVANPKCLLANCGSCIYDFTFDVKMTAAQGGDAFDLVMDTCPGQQDAKTVKVTLPLATQASGEICRYADYGALGWEAMALGTCGKAYMPCREDGGMGMCPLGDGGAACDDGLTCEAGATADARVCQKACTKDDECEATMTCQTGFCRPAGF